MYENLGPPLTFVDITASIRPPFQLCKIVWLFTVFPLIFEQPPECGGWKIGLKKYTSKENKVYTLGLFKMQQSLNFRHEVYDELVTLTLCKQKYPSKRFSVIYRPLKLEIVKFKENFRNLVTVFFVCFVLLTAARSLCGPSLTQAKT